MSVPAVILESFLREQIAAGHFPGAAYLIGEQQRVIAEGAVGDAVVQPQRLPARLGTIYDLASLTKPLATALVAVRLQGEGVLGLEDRLDRHLPEWRPDDRRAALTLLDLLTHRSGLPAWDPLYLYARDEPGRVSRIAQLPLAHAPLEGVLYSDLNYILVGFALQRAAGEPLDRLFERLVRTPAGGGELLFRPGTACRERVAATEDGNERERRMAGAAGDGYNGWRRGIIWGTVHDNNSFTLQGVAGHAGLFGTARAVHSVAREFLPGGKGLLSPEEQALFAHDFTRGLQQARGVGFQLAPTQGSAAGTALSPRAFGHSGFTGTSLWIDPDAGRIHVLLTNRVHPRVLDLDMNGVRRQFHALAARL